MSNSVPGMEICENDEMATGDNALIISEAFTTNRPQSESRPRNIDHLRIHHYNLRPRDSFKKVIKFKNQLKADKVVKQKLAAKPKVDKIIKPKHKAQPKADKVVKPKLSVQPKANKVVKPKLAKQPKANKIVKLKLAAKPKTDEVIKLNLEALLKPKLEAQPKDVPTPASMEAIKQEN